MELTFQSTSLSFLRRTVQEVRYQEETAETIVPDSEPDMAAVIGCHAAAVLRGKDCREGSVILSGGVKALAFYTPEDGTEPRRLEFYIPFTMKIENPALTERSQVQCALTVRSVDGRMINSRKAMVRVSLGCAMAAYEPAQEPLYTLDSPPDALQLRPAVYPLCLPLEAAERTFTVSDTLEIPAGRPPMAQLCKVCCRPELTDQKLVGNKAVFKGLLYCDFLYRAENQSLYLWQQQLPFSQYCELEGDYDEETVEVTLVPTGYDADRQDQEGRSVALTVNLLAQCLVTGQRSVTLLEDAYGAGKVLTPQWQTYSLESRLDSPAAVQTVRAALEGNLKELLSCDVYLGFPQVEREGGQAKVTAPVTFSVLGYDENGALQSCTGSAEAVQTVALSENAQCRPTASLSGECYATLAGGGVEVRCSVRVECGCHGTQALHTLCGGTLEDLPAGEARPSVILRQVQGDESLWDIAKSCGAAEAAIRAANRLETERIQGPAMLLIPVGSN